MNAGGSLSSTPLLAAGLCREQTWCFADQRTYNPGGPDSRSGYLRGET